MLYRRFLLAYVAGLDILDFGRMEVHTDQDPILRALIFYIAANINGDTGTQLAVIKY